MGQLASPTSWTDVFFRGNILPTVNWFSYPRPWFFIGLLQVSKDINLCGFRYPYCCIAERVLAHDRMTNLQSAPIFPLETSHGNIWRFPKTGVPPNHPYLIGCSIINFPAFGVPPWLRKPPCRCSLHRLRAMPAMPHISGCGGMLSRPPIFQRTFLAESWWMSKNVDAYK